jgi:GNAT superfamily N-acetyltransferase
MPIQKIPLAEARSASSVLGEIESIAALNYSNAPVLMAQEYAKNNQIFLYRDPAVEDHAIVGFFMVGWSVIQCGAQSLDSVFLGLSSVDPDRKGQGIGGQLYRAFFADARHWELEHGRRIVWWFHTASSVVAQSIFHIAPECAPQPDGSCSPELLDLLLCIRRSYGMEPYAAPGVPYLLRGYAQTRYADSEVARLRALRAAVPDDLLARLSVDEASGDRLLFVGRVP